jgi:HlyD family secretion protein
VIIDRNVERGQTVAASFNTPRLFIIAEDLSLMEILANVDESDIGQIKTDQAVRFTVASYPERNFEGKVTEIRLQPSVIQNVVNYTVVVETENPNGVLLPGMTATLDFIVEEVEDVLAVPASALSLKLSDEMTVVMMERREQFIQQRQAGAGGESARQQRPEGAQRTAEGRPQRGFGAAGRGGASGFAGGPGGGGPNGGGGARRNIGTLWFKDEGGKLQIMPVRTGVSDGISTEIMALRDEEIPEGLEIISKVLTPSTTQDTRNQGAFGGGDRGPGGGRGPGSGGGLGRLGF